MNAPRKCGCIPWRGRANLKKKSVLWRPWTVQLSREVSADAGTLFDNTAILRDTMKWPTYHLTNWKLTTWQPAVTTLYTAALQFYISVLTALPTFSSCSKRNLVTFKFSTAVLVFNSSRIWRFADLCVCVCIPTSRLQCNGGRLIRNVGTYTAIYTVLSRNRRSNMTGPCTFRIGLVDP